MRYGVTGRPGLQADQSQIWDITGLHYSYPYLRAWILKEAFSEVLHVWRFPTNNLISPTAHSDRSSWNSGKGVVAVTTQT